MRYKDTYWKEIERVVYSIPGIKSLYNKKIMITGSTGMICSVIVEFLFLLNQKYKSGIKIYLAGRNKRKIENRFGPYEEGTDYFYVSYDASLPHFQFMDSVDYIIHGASPADPASYSKFPVETMLSNIFGLKVLLDLTKKNQSTRLLYISSSEVYGKKTNRDAYKEDDYGFVDILNSRACYPDSKRAAETLCASYRKEYGTDFVIVRPGHIYGPSIQQSDSRASAQFTRKAAAGQDIIMKSVGSQLRSYCYTLDCASAILTVLLKGKSGEAYNISNPNSIVTIRELAETLAKLAHVKVVFDLPTQDEKQSYNLMDNSSLNAEKLLALGWEPHYSIEQGGRATLEYYSDSCEIS